MSAYSALRGASSYMFSLPVSFTTHGLKYKLFMVYSDAFMSTMRPCEVLAGRSWCDAAISELNAAETPWPI